MGRFKRFCLIVFALAGALCLAALILPWIGPFQREAGRLFANYYYYLAVLVVTGITMLGLFVTLLRGLFAPAKRKEVTIEKSGGDKITVTTDAISSQATHVVEDGGHFIAEKVQVATKRSGDVSVDVRIKPRRVVNVVDEGRQLHDDLATGLSAICGDKVRHINLQFVEAETPEPAQNVTIENLQIPASVYEHAAQLEAANRPQIQAEATYEAIDGTSEAETVSTEGEVE